MKPQGLQDRYPALPWQKKEEKTGQIPLKEKC